MKKINTMKIEGKRWFQRSYGNTYHTVKVFVDGEILKSEITYGYGSHYLQTAAELLILFAIRANRPELTAKHVFTGISASGILSFM